MRKYKIYLDTSTISCLDQTESPERKQDSENLWKIFEAGTAYEVIVSDLTLVELQRCDSTKREFFESKLNNINATFISASDEVMELAELYREQGVLSSKSIDDLRHIAYAIVHGCDYIVSWNFKHFVNIKTINAVNGINRLYGYRTIEIVSPNMLLEQ